MQLGERLDDSPSTASNRDVVRVVDGWYEMVERGYQRPMPVLHYHGRTESGAYRHWSVDGFRPYFYLAQDDIGDDDIAALDADRRVLDIERAAKTGIDSGAYDIPLVRVSVEKPWHVAQLRDEFPRSFEADVRFAQRFLIDCSDTETRQTAYVKIPCEQSLPLSPDDVTAVESDSVQDSIQPRVAVWDIEVATNEALDVVPTDIGDLSAGMPDIDSPRKPITAVTLYDSYDETYATVALRGETDEWQSYDNVESLDYESGQLYVVDTERALIHRVVDWLLDRRPGVLTGWNSNAFDWPYFVNRAHYLDEGETVQQLSPTRNIDEHHDGGSWVNSDVTGIHLVDLMAAYKKSQYTALKSSTLEYVAAKETEMPKLDVDEQWTYANDPAQFLEYNVRDVAACVAINEQNELL